MRPETIKLLETGFAAQQRGDMAEAEQCYREVLRDDAGNEFALNLMGVLMIRQDNYRDAADYLECALMVNAGDPETHNNLGLAYKGLNRFRDAAVAFRTSLEIDAQQPATFNNLGNVLAAIDNHADAVECFEAALRLAPDFSDCLNNLAVSLKELGRFHAAIRAVDRAVELEPSRSQLHNTRGELLLRDARHEEALECFKAAINIDQNLAARVNLSTVLKQLGRIDEARDILTEVLADEPGHAEAHHHLGVLLEQSGDTQGAVVEHRLALHHDPTHTSSYYQIAKLGRERLSAAELARVNSLVEDDGLLDVLRAPLYFALASEFEKDKKYAQSMRFFAEGQAIKARRHPYDSAAVTAYTEAARELFPLGLDLEVKQSNEDPVPVFVIGMPRSGTTLTEQILTSHSEIEGAGEVGFIRDLANLASKATGRPFPACAAALRVSNVQELRQAYFARMRQRCGEARFVIDKNPLNYNFAGFIATVFPEAKLIYCQRAAIDNCVSIFRLPFDDNQGYSHDLAALGHFYREHEKLMNHWFDSYPRMIHTVRYEDTVEDVERQARRMLEFIGVEFEARVLDFHENSRTVLTPSAEQVRQPIYRSSVDMWKRYGSAIDPLIAALDRHAEA